MCDTDFDFSAIVQHAKDIVIVTKAYPLNDPGPEDPSQISDRTSALQLHCNQTTEYFNLMDRFWGNENLFGDIID